MFASLFGPSSNHKKDYKEETSNDEFIIVEKTEIPEVSPAPLLTERYQQQANTGFGNPIGSTSSLQKVLNINDLAREHRAGSITASEDKSDAFDSKDNVSYGNLHMIPFVLSHHVRAICFSTSYQKPITLSDCNQFKHDFAIEEKALRDANLWHE